MAGRAAHQSPSEPPASPARARCARRAGAGGARGAWLPPTTTRIPRRARGARVQALTAPLHTPHGKGGPVPKPTHPTHRHVRHEREAWAGQVRVGRVAGWVSAPRRAPSNVLARTSGGRWPCALHRTPPPPCDPTATMRDPSTPTTRAPSASGVIGWVLAARRASPNVGARTSGRWPSMSAGRHPLGAHCDNGRPEHGYHARAERAGRDWVGLSTTSFAFFLLSCIQYYK